MAFKAAGHLLKSGYLDGNLRPLLQNEVGYHIGAEEDDSSIEMVIECSIIDLSIDGYSSPAH